MDFVKMHGNGNDYVYAEIFTQDLPDLSKLAVEVSDRHFGIGSDGLIIAAPSEKAHVKMIMFNADGSEGAMCGNGIRCLAKFVYDKGLVRENPMTIETRSGIKTLYLEVEENKVKSARVNMGAPVFKPKDIPVELPEGHSFNHSLSLTEDFALTVNVLSMGNPHAVIFLNEHDKNILDRLISDKETVERHKIPAPYVLLNHLELLKWGKLVEKHNIFPQSVNTEFVEILDRNHIAMRVWERGSGETLSCGTGCCACAVAGIKKGLLDNKVEVRTIGGSLIIEWSGKEEDPVYMTGPATVVFQGTY